jgi:hypothetical protein
MRKADFKRNHEMFEEWIDWYGYFLNDIIAAKRVVRTKEQKTELLEALALKCATRWEELVEVDIITSLNRDSSVYASALGLNLKKHLSWDMCKAMVCGHRYVDFRSVGEIKGFARNYLSADCNPFEAITSDLVKKIDEFIIIRNYIAHGSDYAMRAYRRLMKTNYKLKRIPEPGDFLSAVDSSSGKMRWVLYLLAFQECSKKMVLAMYPPTSRSSLRSRP